MTWPDNAESSVAPGAPESTEEFDSTALPLERSVRVAARALSRAGLAQAFGHVSARLDSASFAVCPPMPMGLVPVGMRCPTVPVEGPLPDGVPGEVRIHQSIYAQRPDIAAVCRIQPPAVMTLSTMGLLPRARHGFGCYVAQDAQFWDDIQLVRDQRAAAAVAKALGNSSSVILRGNGAVVASSSLRRAVALSWFLEDAARIELEHLRAGTADSAPVITDDEAARRATWSGGIEDRMWAHLVAGDPEYPPS